MKTLRTKRRQGYFPNQNLWISQSAFLVSVKLYRKLYIPLQIVSLIWTFRFSGLHIIIWKDDHKDQTHILNFPALNLQNEKDSWTWMYFQIGAKGEKGQNCFEQIYLQVTKCKHSNSSRQHTIGGRDWERKKECVLKNTNHQQEYLAYMTEFSTIIIYIKFLLSGGRQILR